MNTSNPINRRAALRNLTAGSLLAMGLWPGALRAADKDNSGSFRFLVINDTHYLDEACGKYLDGVVQKMKKEKAEFCLHAGDVTDRGQREHHAAVRDVFKGLGLPFHATIGNHDYATQTDRKGYEEMFPKQINYHFENGGWQFVGLDSSDGQNYEKTEVQPATFTWLDDNLKKLDKTKPTVILTHFPMGEKVTYRPKNADDLLERFLDYNLQAVFCGHFHGFTERTRKGVAITTNRCCALKRTNHDNTKEKGYFVCTTKDGKVTREFVEYKPA